MVKVYCLVLSLFLLSMNSSAESLLPVWEKQTTVKTLPSNGLTIVYVYRPTRPTFSVSVFFEVGHAQDPPNKGGLAHMFEHMAFMGTKTIGTFNYPQEKIALEATEQAFQAYNQARLRGDSADIVATLEKKWQLAIQEAGKYVDLGKIDRIASEAGCPGLDARTARNWTRYTSSFPNSQFEKWAHLESERWLHPVIAREFYKERNVVMEEYSDGRDRPDFQIQEHVLPLIFKDHPYGRSGIGTTAELQSLSATDAQPFFQRYYTPANMVVAIVGGVPPQQGLPLVESYFGRFPRGPKPNLSLPPKPSQQGELRTELFLKTRPSYVEFYLRPGSNDPNHSLYDVLVQLLLTNPNAFLQRKLVEKRKVAESIKILQTYDFYEGKYAPFGIQIFPSGTHSLNDVREAFHQEIENFMTTPVDSAELQIAKNLLRAQALKQIEDSDELAILFGTAQLIQGDWHSALRSIDTLNQVTPAQILTTAQQMFAPTNRTATWVYSKDKK